MTAAAIRRPAPRNLLATDGGHDTSAIRLNATAFSSDEQDCRQQSDRHSGEIERKTERVKSGATDETAPASELGTEVTHRRGS